MGGGLVKNWPARLLLAFVLVTIGFALGRMSAPPPAESADTLLVAANPDVEGGVLVVWSAHMTFRCLECSQIEFLTKQVLEEDFAEQLADGRIEFRSVDYMRDLAFARRYDVAASTVVLAKIIDGEELRHQRLDEVWTKLRDHDEFRDYVRKAIREMLN